MRSWSINKLGIRSGRPRVLFSSDDSRAIALRLGAGERLSEHGVHERSWVMPVSGEVEVTSVKSRPVRGGPGLVIELNARERHEVVACEDSHLLLLLTPWPGTGHPGTIPYTARPPLRVRATERTASAAQSPSATGDDGSWSLDPLSPLP